jgi:DNA-binding NarL/FixJ family response regulator
MPDGSQKCYEARVYPICDSSGRSIYAIKMGFDVTDKKLAGDRHLEYVEALEISLREGINNVVGSHSGSRNGKISFGLSKREIQVLRLMSEGFSNIEISNALDVSPHTVKTHVTHILNKIGVSDRTQAAVLAARLGVI